MEQVQRDSLLPPALQGLRINGHDGHVLPEDCVGTGNILFPEAPPFSRVPSVLDVMAVGSGLQHLRRLSGDVDAECFAPFGLPFHDESLLDNDQEQRGLHVLCMAGARKEAVEFEYVSKAGVRRFRFSPLRVVRFSDRIRVRGYAQALDGAPVYENGGDGEYLDIVPSRILLPVQRTSVPLQRSPDGDVEWSTWGQVEATFRPDLATASLDALHEEYSEVLDEEGKGIVLARIRHATSFYICRGLRARTIGANHPVFVADSCRFVADSAASLR